MTIATLLIARDDMVDPSRVPATVKPVERKLPAGILQQERLTGHEYGTAPANLATLTRLDQGQQLDFWIHFMIWAKIEPLTCRGTTTILHCLGVSSTREL